MTLQQGFAWWSFTETHRETADLLEVAAEIGYGGVDFLPAELWPAARSLDLDLIIIDGHDDISVGFNDASHHAGLAGQVLRNLDLAVREGVRNLAVSVGDHTGASDHDAIASCVAGLAPLATEAESAGVGLLLEPLNSKVDHPGHQCDRTAWGKAVVSGVGSPALRLLYDAYHMQIMEGDLLRTITENLAWIGHVHTAGVPGRHELDDRQEINWPAVARRLNDIGYRGYVTHELIPAGNPVAALREAFERFRLRGD